MLQTVGTGELRLPIRRVSEESSPSWSTSPSFDSARSTGDADLELPRVPLVPDLLRGWRITRAATRVPERFRARQVIVREEFLW